jgi:hypothetical protein
MCHAILCQVIIYDSYSCYWCYSIVGGYMCHAILCQVTFEKL